jgi:hypothetical protein
MADRSERFLKIVGIGQGVQWLWTLGGGTVVSFLTGGVLALSSLPLWAIAGAMAGVFMLTVAAIVTIRTRIGRPSPLTPIIERGFSMRERLVADQQDGSDPKHVASWRTRLDDWIEEARTTIRAIAPNREPGFTLDILIADPSPDRPWPYWKAELLSELDVSIERLILVRASL